MNDLNKTKVYRCGISQNDKPRQENTNCSFSVNENDLTITIGLFLSSAGGGTTNAKIEISKEDFSKIAEEVALKMPEFSAGIFLKCAATANSKISELLEDRNNIYTKIENAEKKLSKADEMLWKKFGYLNVNERDKIEVEVDKLILSAMDSLK